MNIEFELTTTQICILSGISYFLIYCFFLRFLTKDVKKDKSVSKQNKKDYKILIFFCSLLWPITLVIIIMFILPLIGVEDND